MTAPETTPSLEAAWAEVEAALPKGWWLHGVAAYSFDDMAWRAEAATAARHFWAGTAHREKGAGTRIFAFGPSIHAFGPTPAAALHALAVKLTEAGL